MAKTENKTTLSSEELAAKVDSLTAEIAGKDTQIAEANATIANKDTRIAELSAELESVKEESSEKDELIASFNEASDKGNAMIAELMGKIAEMDAAPKAAGNTVKVGDVHYELVVPKSHLKIASSETPVLATIDSIRESEEQQLAAIKAGILIEIKTKA